MTRFGEQLDRVASSCRELTYELDKDDVVKVATALRNEADFGFEMLMDVCGVDYLGYGDDEWTTNSATGTGLSRGVGRTPVIHDEADEFETKRFAVVYHLLSAKNNVRLRLRVYTGASNPPIVKSVVDIWNGANWFEREVFDLYGILFEGHLDFYHGLLGHWRAVRRERGALTVVRGHAAQCPGAHHAAGAKDCRLADKCRYGGVRIDTGRAS